MKSRFALDNEEDDNEELDWKDSYSDLMTDLLAVFVLLLSFALLNQAVYHTSGQEAKQEADIVSEGAVGILLKEDGVLEENNIDVSNQENDTSDQESMDQDHESMDQIEDSLDDYIKEASYSDELSVIRNGNNEIILRVASSLLFESGSADINSGVEPMFLTLSQLLQDHKEAIKMIRIEGHTDNVPIHSARFSDNWELSITRAVNVLNRLVSLSNLESNMFSAVGYGEFHPIADNDTEEGRNKNRRVEFIIEANPDTMKDFSPDIPEYK